MPDTKNWVLPGHYFETCNCEIACMLTLLQWQLHELSWLSPMMVNQTPPISCQYFIFGRVLSVYADKKCLLDTLQNPDGFFIK